MLVLIATLLVNAPDPILAADAQWRQALVGKNQAAFEKIVAPEYFLATAMGVMPRAHWMANALIWDTKAIEWRGTPHVDVYADSAVVSGTLHWHVIKDKPDPRTGSKEMDQDFLVTDVWVRRAGHWQVVARHSTIPVAPPAPPTKR
jgi:hypothetical protein